MRTSPCTLIIAMLLCIAFSPLLANNANNGTPSLPEPLYTGLDEEIIKLRLRMMACPVRAEYNNDVAAYLRRYLTYGLEDTERMLSDAQLYFPIFEHYLEMYGMPKQLKFLPMIESSMVPYAVSYSGAAGLWQFMPSTGEYMGLIIDKYLDERKDPYKSTEAAIKYLNKMYKRFGNWELALAAYNCGPGRLSRTIREYNSEDYWEIKEGLPRETQKYINRFVAACYAGTFHIQHGIIPKAPDILRLQPLAARIYAPVSLKNVSYATGVGMDTLRQLNPSFKLDHTPARSNGIFLVLPKNSWYDYLDAKNSSSGNAVVRP